MIATRFTELVGCTRYRSSRQAWGRAHHPELVAAVSEAGALGMLGTARPGLTPATLADLLERTRLLTDKPFGVNFIVAPIFLNGSAMRPPLDLTCIEIAARARESRRVLLWRAGKSICRNGAHSRCAGLLASWVTGGGSRGRPSGMGDFVVAQGIEAGGHVRGTIPMATTRCSAK